ncbi:MAG: hypothetical protein ABJA94_12245, partial [Rhodoglobus sp.]
ERRMSLAFLSKPIGGSKKGTDSVDAKEPKQGRTPGPSRGAGNIAVGGAPRVDLMPAEIRTKRAQLRTRRSLRVGLFGVFVVVVVACAATVAGSLVAANSLQSAQSQQEALIAEQGKYSDITSSKTAISLIKAGQVVADSSEIDWQAYLSSLQATLPAGVVLTDVGVTVADPLTPYPVSVEPLQGPRIAVLSFTATSQTLPSIPAWLDGLKQLKGYVDATPGQVTLGESGYSANVVMHIGTDAFAPRFGSKQDANANSGGN